MVQAAVEGAIDFSTADLLARNWWTKLVWIVNAVEKRNSLTILTRQHAQHIAVLDYQNFTLDKNLFEKHWKDANDVMTNMFNLLHPWESKKTESPKDKYKDIFEQWKNKYGDIKDPAVKAKFDQLADKINNINKQKKEKAKNTKSPRQLQQDALRKVVEGRRNKRKEKK